MMRKIAIGLAAAVIATAGSTWSASAMHGGGRGGGAAHVTGGAGAAHVSGHYGGPSTLGRGFAKGGPRAYAFHGREFERGRPYRYGNYKYRHGYYRPYAYGGSCWTRVLTPGGWVSKYVCGYERPYYGGYYRYGHYRPFYGHRYGGYGRPYGRR
jgi:hypothetical protein